MKQEVLLGFKTDEETKAKLKDYSERTRRSMSGSIKYAVDKLLEAEYNDNR